MARVKGIAKEYLSRLFKGFYRIDMSRSRREGDSGLDLSIKPIVEIHKQNISVTGELGKGTVFCFMLPIAFKA